MRYLKNPKLNERDIPTRNLSSNMSSKISDIIAKKRDGGCLSEDEIEYFVKGLTSGYVQDVQVGE